MDKINKTEQGTKIRRKETEKGNVGEGEDGRKREGGISRKKEERRTLERSS